MKQPELGIKINEIRNQLMNLYKITGVLEILIASIINLLALIY